MHQLPKTNVIIMYHKHGVIEALGAQRRWGSVLSLWRGQGSASGGNRGQGGIQVTTGQPRVASAHASPLKWEAHQVWQCLSPSNTSSSHSLAPPTPTPTHSIQTHWPPHTHDTSPALASSVTYISVLMYILLSSFLKDHPSSNTSSIPLSKIGPISLCPLTLS